MPHFTLYLTTASSAPSQGTRPVAASLMTLPRAH
eukprot:CAMPEP_0198430288 /NCGR_PEP_ID=MMETSP1452-20131203/12652_1 /TAXON_ID=1181717 /ORGANISM="Synchroma pusillum, Strain CCMP3072" /LENGTH=33 /DNA_ID= /DNA_START= /DNA_END= /DNA_ORIENTATION=